MQNIMKTSNSSRFQGEAKAALRSGRISVNKPGCLELNVQLEIMDVD